MSEVQSRPATRGRSSARGGRSGHGSTRHGPRTSNKHTDGDHLAPPSDDIPDQGEFGELKRQYSSQLSTLKELFPDWTDMDLLFAVQESDGDLQRTIEGITEGNVSQFSEIKKKDRSRSKVKEGPMAGGDGTGLSTRGARGRGGQDTSRGGRGRTDRGRGGHRGSRGGAHASTNGTRTASASVPTTESSAWDGPTPGESAEGGAWDQPGGTAGETEGTRAAKKPAAPGPKPVVVPAEPPKKTWASMFAKPKPPPVVPKSLTPVPAPQETPAPPPAEPQPPTTTATTTIDGPVATEAPLNPPEVTEDPAADEPVSLENITNGTPNHLQEEAALEIAPSKDELTQDNVEHIPDTSQPPPTETAASTVGSTVGPATPLNNAPQQQQPISRQPLGGFAATALKATSGGHRSASFQRRIIEQQEAVVMPGNHAIDRAAVQFGSLGLNGEADTDALNVDEDREEAETRTQPPTHSPTQPRASLPPVPRQQQQQQQQQQQAAELPAQDTPIAPKQAPGLPPPQQQQQQQQAAQPQQQSPQNTIGSQAMQQQGSQGGQQYNQFGGRFGQPNLQSETAAPGQKPYDPFGQQIPHSSQFDNYPAQSQAPSQPQQAAQSQLSGFSSGPNDYPSSYYTSDQRQAYHNYYGNSYNQQSAPSQQEAGNTQQRSGSAFGAGPNESTFPSSQSQQQTQARYSDAQNSGHNTPNPTMAAQHQAGPQSQQAQHAHQPHAQPGHAAGGYPFNHPYYNSPYYQQYMSQYGYGQGYGNFGKAGMYGQPHGYGISPQTSYDQHSSSPANVSGFGASMHGRDSTLGGGLSDYGRSNSTQPSQSQQHSGATGSFGAVPDVFGRSQSGFTGQNQTYSQQPASQQTGTEDSLKPFGDSAKQGSGPSPSSIGQPGRPGSAANNTPGQGTQSSLPPPQSHQQGFSGYPSHLNQHQGGPGGQFGLSGLGGHQAGTQNHQAAGYGAYSGFGNYGSYGRGGWGGNYGQH